MQLSESAKVDALLVALATAQAANDELARQLGELGARYEFVMNRIAEKAPDFFREVEDE